MIVDGILLGQMHNVFGGVVPVVIDITAADWHLYGDLVIALSTLWCCFVYTSSILSTSHSWPV